MKTKKTLAGVLSGSLLMLTLPVAIGLTVAQNTGLADSTSAQAFTDVTASNPHYTAIKYLKDHGVIGGYPDGSFKPDQTVNRAEALKIILLGSGVQVASSVSTSPFSDVESGAWFAVYVQKAKDLAVVGGYSDGTFKPAQTVNLVENLKILFLTQKVDLSTTTVTGNPYADAMMGQWYTTYAQYAKNKNIIDADSNNMVYPAQGMTRGSLAETIYRLMYINANGLAKYGDVAPTQQTTQQQTQQQTQQTTQQQTQQQTQQTTQQQTQQQTQQSSTMCNKTAMTAGSMVTLNSALTDSTGNSAVLNFSAGTDDQISGSAVAAGNLLRIDNEVMLVTAYNATSNTATVIRGFAKTTAATHSMGATVSLSTVGATVTNIRSGSEQFSSDTAVSVLDNTNLVSGDIIAVVSGTSDLEYEQLTGFNAGTNWYTTRGLYGTTAIDHPELTSMVVQFPAGCTLN